MKDFILFMYNDAADDSIAGDGKRWGENLSRLRSSGDFNGGSSIGAGLRIRKGHPDLAATPELDGFIHVINLMRDHFIQPAGPGLRPTTAAALNSSSS